MLYYYVLATIQTMRREEWATYVCGMDRLSPSYDVRPPSMATIAMQHSHGNHM